MDPTEDPDDILRANRSREKTFMFDMVFDRKATQVSEESLPVSLKFWVLLTFAQDAEARG